MDFEQMKAFLDNRKGLTATALKWIALATMIVDHVAYTLGSNLLSANTYVIMRGIGRIAFPLFAFCVVEGYLHTHSFRKYLLRMIIFAVISEVPFDIMISKAWVATAHNNVLWTFVILLGVLRLCELVKQEIFLKRQNPVLGIALTALSVAAGATVAYFANTDYSWCGILLGASFYLFRDRRWLMYLCAALSLTLLSINNWIELLAVLSLGLTLLYDGRKSLIEKELPKYFFYVLYPLHMLMLGLYGILLQSGI